jgi:hypothetical protein
MKKGIYALVLAMLLAATLVAPALAAQGGMPGAHGVDGRTFGSLVSELAKSEPGAVAEHVSNAGGNGGGMPAAHGVDGRTFGYLVSELAKSAPGAVAAHVSGK